MTPDVPAPVTNDSPAPLCERCGHPLVAHDALSLRWCAATKLGAGARDCICSAAAVKPRVLSHY